LLSHPPCWRSPAAVGAKVGAEGGGQAVDLVVEGGLGGDDVLRGPLLLDGQASGLSSLGKKRKSRVRRV
jgi:hypothetical protein